MILGAGQSDTTLIDAFRERFLRPRRADAYTTLRRGIVRGELPASLDLDLILDALYGPIYMRFLIGHDTLTPELVDQLCALVLERSRESREQIKPWQRKKKLRKRNPRSRVFCLPIPLLQVRTATRSSA